MSTEEYTKVKNKVSQLEEEVDQIVSYMDCSFSEVSLDLLKEVRVIKEELEVEKEKLKNLS